MVMRAQLIEEAMSKAIDEGGGLADAYRAGLKVCVDMAVADVVAHIHELALDFMRSNQAKYWTTLRAGRYGIENKRCAGIRGIRGPGAGRKNPKGRHHRIF